VLGDVLEGHKVERVLAVEVIVNLARTRPRVGSDPQFLCDPTTEFPDLGPITSLEGTEFDPSGPATGRTGSWEHVGLGLTAARSRYSAPEGPSQN
jgi:hypothetical protein